MENTRFSNAEIKDGGYTGYGHAGSRNQEARYISVTDVGKNLRKILKEKYQSCTFSVVGQKYSGGQSISIALMNAPFEVFDKNYKQDKNGNTYTEKDWGYSQLNHYSLGKEADGYCNGSYLTPDAIEVLKFAMKECQSFNYSDSDGMIDYFHTNFYLHLSVGKWDKPFIKG